MNISKALITRLKVTAAYDSADFTRDLDKAYVDLQKSFGLLDSPNFKKHIGNLDAVETKQNFAERLKKLTVKLGEVIDEIEDIQVDLDEVG